MTSISNAEICCPCGHKYQIPLYASVNTELNPEAVDKFLAGRLNVAACPTCSLEMLIITPVLFHDMERGFMVYAGSQEHPDGHIEDMSKTPVVFVEEYFVAVGALKKFRANPANAPVPYHKMEAATARAFAESYRDLYLELLKAEPKRTRKRRPAPPSEA